MNKWMTAVALASAVLAGCAGAEDEPSDTTVEKSPATGTGKTVQRGVSAWQPDVYTVNYPLAYFAGRIGGGAVSVVFPAPADIDPAFWKPGPGVIADYQRAHLILLNGADYAKWITVASLPEGRLLDTSAAARDRYVEIESHVTHTHGPGGEHAHGGIAFTTWLDFTVARAQAGAVHAGIAGVAADTSGLSTRYLELAGELDGLDRAMSEVAVRLQGRALLASHPVYQYLAARYGLDIRSVTWEPDEAPAEAQWGRLEAMRTESAADIMLWEGQPLATTRTRLEGNGIRVVIFDPCGNHPAQGADFMTVIRANIEALGAAAR